MNPLLPLEYLLPLAAVLIGGGLALSWASTRSCARRLRLGLLTLRGAVAALLLLLALNPGHWQKDRLDADSDWIVLLDRSRSMAVEDAGGRARIQAAVEAARRAVEGEADPARVQVRTFAGKLDPDPATVESLTTIAPDGPATDAPRAGNDLLDLYDGRDRTLAGILLISDGRRSRAGGDEDFARRALARGLPVHVLPLGGAVEQPDLSLSIERRQWVQFPGQEVTLRVSVQNKGLGPVRARLRLLTPGGEVLDTRETDLADGARRRVAFTLPDGETALRDFRIEAAEQPGEKTAKNNHLKIEVLRMDEPIRVLLVEGTPHWDNKFLIQLLRRQPHLALTTVHRVTNKRFFRVLSGEDQAQAVRTVFPGTLDALSEFDVVIMGRGADYFLTDRHANLLEQYVREIGGAVLFSRGKSYHGDFPALARLEPVEWGPGTLGPRRWRPVPSGGRQFFGDILPGSEAAIWDHLSPVTGVQECRRVKAFSDVLAEGRPAGGDGERAVPLFITRRVGTGMVALMNGEGLWQWDFFPQNEQSGDLYKRFWVELLQWMTTRTGFLPGRGLSIRLSHHQARAGEPVKAVVRMRRAGDAEAPPTVVITRNGDPVQELYPQLDLDAGPTRRAETVFTPDAEGRYRIAASWGDETATALLRVPPPPGEADRLSADPEALRRLADFTGGTVLAPEAAAGAAGLFAPREREREAGSVEWVPWWDHPALLLLLGALALTEWTLRRRNGLL